MNKKDIAYISLRVLSIYIFITVLHSISINLYQLIYSSISNIGKGNNLLILSGMIPLLTAGIILWVYSERLVDYIILKNTRLDEKSDTMNAKDLQIIAFSIVGIILIVTAIPPLINKSIYLTIESHPIKVGIYLSLIEEVAKLFIGIILLFCSNGISGLIFLIRNIGTVKKEDRWW